MKAGMTEQRKDMEGVIKIIFVRNEEALERTIENNL